MRSYGECIVVYKEIWIYYGTFFYFDQKRIDKHVASSPRLNVIAISAIFNQPLCDRLSEAFPDLLPGAIIAINRFLKDIKCSTFSCDVFCCDSKMANYYPHIQHAITLDRKSISQALLVLLLKLPKSNKFHYTYTQKRILEQHYLQKINSSSDIKSLCVIYDSIITSSFLNYKRHAHYDSLKAGFFNRHNQPHIKQVITDAMYKKTRKLLTDNDLPYHGELRNHPLVKRWSLSRAYEARSSSDMDRASSCFQNTP